MSKHSDIFTISEVRLDVEVKVWAVLAHVGEGLRDGLGTGVRLRGVAAGVLFGFRDVPAWC